MAVYTALTQAEIEAFLLHYEVGTLVSFKGITEGVENTNYLLIAENAQGTHVRYILTIYEQRVNPDDLPFFLGLTEWLANRGIDCPMPVKGKTHQAIYQLKNKPAALIEYLEGMGSPHITPYHMTLTGELAAKMHLGAKDFSLSRKNSLSIDGWQTLFSLFAGQADDITPGLAKEMEDELHFLAQNWPEHLPEGVIHADIFPDNVFFMDGNTDQPQLSGVIDFYFACNDYWMYDLMICMNAWCFDLGHEFVHQRAEAFLQAYHALRPITKEEQEAVQILGRGASMRFLVTRAYDWLNRVPDALVNPKDPMEYVKKLRFYRNIKGWQDLGITLS